jgi:molybdate transport system substrate-binding protein
LRALSSKIYPLRNEGWTTSSRVAKHMPDDRTRARGTTGEKSGFSRTDARRQTYFGVAIASVILLLLAGSNGCRRALTNEQSEVREINVAAAANLSEAFNELGKQFTARTGIRVVYSFGSTADLAKQIENGAPFDLFAAADTEHVEQLNRQRLIVPGTAALYARGRLLVWTPAGSSIKLDRIEDLRRAEVERISIARPDAAPYGRAAVEALRALDLWKDIEPKVIYGQNVSQAKQYVATGNADAALLPRSLIREGEGHSIAVDERLHQPINQSLAIIQASGKQEAARLFSQHILSPEGQSLLQRYGYERAVTSDEPNAKRDK